MNDTTKTPPAMDGDETPDVDDAPERPSETTDDSAKSAAELRAELDLTRSALAKANAEARDRRLKLKELEEEAEARRKAEMSETERAKAERDEALKARDAIEKQLREVTLRHAVEMAAIERDFHDPRDAFLLADLTTVEVDEDGRAHGVNKALDALAKAKPHLVKGKTSPGRVPATPKGSSGQSLDREELERVRSDHARNARATF